MLVVVLIRFCYGIEFLFEYSVKSAGSGGIVLCLETEDVDGAIAKAVSAGGVVEGEIAEGDGACCGGRVGKVKDPYGFIWLICSPSKKSANVEA